MGEVTLRSKGVGLVCLHTCRQTRPRAGPGPYAVVAGLPGDNQVEYDSIRQNAPTLAAHKWRDTGGAARCVRHRPPQL